MRPNPIIPSCFVVFSLIITLLLFCVSCRASRENLRTGRGSAGPDARDPSRLLEHCEPYWYSFLVGRWRWGFHCSAITASRQERGSHYRPHGSSAAAALICGHCL